MLQPFFSAMGAGDIFDEIGESRSLGKGVDIGVGLDNGDGVGSTSTTRTTALPSRTFLTLSASKSFLSDDGEDEDEELHAARSVNKVRFAAVCVEAVQIQGMIRSRGGVLKDCTPG